jgi:hypothetical protein
LGAAGAGGVCSPASAKEPVPEPVSRPARKNRPGEYASNVCIRRVIFFECSRAGMPEEVKEVLVTHIHADAYDFKLVRLLYQGLPVSGRRQGFCADSPRRVAVSSGSGGEHLLPRMMDFNLLRHVVIRDGEDCSNTLVIPPLPYTDERDTCPCVDDYDAPCPPTAAPDVVYESAPPADRTVTVNLGLPFNETHDTKLYVYQDNCPDVRYYACDDDGCLPLNGSCASILAELPLQAGSTYYFVVDGSVSLNCGPCRLEVTDQ